LYFRRKSEDATDLATDTYCIFNDYLLSCLLTYLLTPWNEVFLENL